MAFGRRRCAKREGRRRWRWRSRQARTESGGAPCRVKGVSLLEIAADGIEAPAAVGRPEINLGGKKPWHLYVGNLFGTWLQPRTSSTGCSMRPFLAHWAANRAPEPGLHRSMSRRRITT